MNRENRPTPDRGANLSLAIPNRRRDFRMGGLMIDGGYRGRWRAHPDQHQAALSASP
jgi:hypothetical protein